MTIYLATMLRPQLLGMNPCRLDVEPISLQAAQDLVEDIDPEQSPRPWYSLVPEGYQSWLSDWLGIEINAQLKHTKLRNGDQILLCTPSTPPQRKGDDSPAPANLRFIFTLLTITKEANYDHA